jgi:hypothetical protein
LYNEADIGLILFTVTRPKYVVCSIESNSKEIDLAIKKKATNVPYAAPSRAITAVPVYFWV